MNTFADLEARVRELLTAVRDRVQTALEWVCRQFNDSPVRWMGPLGIIAARKLSAAIETIQRKVAWLIREVWRFVAKVAGEPGELMRMSTAYVEAAGVMRGVEPEARAARRHVQKGWEGDAYIAFDGLSTDQERAALGANEVLTKASTACANAARQIKSSWVDIVDYVLDLADTVAELIVGATDAGQWFTLDAGPVTAAIIRAVTDTGRVVTDLAEYVNNDATVNSAQWRDVGQGGISFPECRWPSLERRDVHDMRTQGDWTAA